MSVLLFPLIILATLLVILSGIWVSIALIGAVWHVDRRGGETPAAPGAPETRDITRNPA